MLERIDDGLWIATDPELRMLGIRLGTRMTVLRLPDGKLWVHSPIRPSDALRRELDALGEVAHIVAPNLYHHLHAGELLAAYPGAKLHAAHGLAKKRPDLRIDGELSTTPDAAWGGMLTPLAIEGSMLGETVFHVPSMRTVISADLTENFVDGSTDFATNTYLKLNGIHGTPGLARILRPIFRDRKKTRASIDRLLELDFDRALIAHGEILRMGAKDVVRATYTWL